MKCPKCYNEIPNDSKTCPICQTIFASFFEETKLTKKQKLKLLLHKSIFILITLTFVLTIVFILYNEHKTKMNRITDINNLKLDKTSKKYINDLYISDERHYEYLLNEKEKEIYEKVINAIKNNEEIVEIDLNKYNIELSTFQTNTLKNIRSVISMDHPELISYTGLNISNLSNNNIKLKINKLVINEELEINKILEIINEIKTNTKNMDEYEKVKYVYDWFYQNTELISGKNIDINATYSCLINKECNSYSYAKSVQIIMQNLKINSLLATGIFENNYKEWNIIKIKNKYYYYDQTLALKNEISYDGLLFYSSKYKLYYKKLMPNISKKKYTR